MFGGDGGAGQLQAVEADVAGALLILRKVVAQVVNRHRMHTPKERFPGDITDLFGAQLQFVWLGLGTSLIGADTQQRCGAGSGQQGEGLSTIEVHGQCSIWRRRTTAKGFCSSC
ncbi:hypothetical protein D3C84_821910 [compost metagenome]